MNNRSTIKTNMSGLAKVIGFTAFFFLTAGAAMAQSSMKVTGEVVSANKTTINGFSAVSGATVFNNNRIRTGKDGAAIINLGRLGRIELGPETDLTIRISDSTIGGDLRSNQITVSARAGTAIAVNTAEGVVRSDGREPTVLTICVDGKRPRVITHLGAANVVAAGGNSPSIVRQTAVRAAFAAPTLARLFKAGVDRSMGPKLDDNGGPSHNKPFETSITCGASHGRNCLKKSNYRP